VPLGRRRFVFRQEREEGRGDSQVRKQKGFSLIELLIVVAIILIIAAIAIPNLIRSKMSANESSAVASMRTINTSCVEYSTTYNIGFPASLANLGTSGAASSASADLIDSVLAGSVKAGYVFTYTADAADVSGTINAYTITAVPSVPGATGTRTFFTDQTNVIRADSSGSGASVNSTPIS
jgi:type IV pilus assembly protein PilA